MGNLNKIEAWGDTWASTDGILLRACDDSVGVTAAFNLNLLERINPELGGDFRLSSSSRRRAGTGSRTP
jgi:uncharacterized SAM-dependent methyltransferase